MGAVRIMEKKSKLVYLLYAILIIVLIAMDQATKVIVDSQLAYQKSEVIIDHFFYFTYTHNFGAAWSLLQGATTLFIAFAIIAVVGLFYVFYHSKKDEIFTRFGVALVMSGAIGNVIDRVVYGYVRDFIDFVIFGYDFPIFNVADMCIVVGVFLIVFEMMGEEYKTWKQSK